MAKGLEYDSIRRTAYTTTRYDRMSWGQRYKNIVDVYPQMEKEELARGVCHGLAMLYAQSIFCGEHTIFNQQLSLLAQSEWLLCGKTYTSLNEVIKTALQINRDMGGVNRYQAQKYIDTRAFLDALLSFQGKANFQCTQNPGIVAPWLMPSKLKPNTHWHLLYKDVLYLTQPQALKQKISAIFMAAQKNLSHNHQWRTTLLISTTTHTIALSQSKNYQYELHNHGRTLSIPERNLGLALFRVLKDGSLPLLISVSLYTMPSFLKKPILPTKPHPVIDYYFREIHGKKELVNSNRPESIMLKAALKEFHGRYGFYDAFYSATSLAPSLYLVPTFVSIIISWVLLCQKEKCQTALGDFYLFGLCSSAHDLDSVKSATGDVTPFYLACENGCLNLVLVLLNSDKIDHNQAGKNGVTPFYLACQNGCLNLVLALLNSDKINHNLAGENGITPFYVACQNGHLDLVLALLNSDKIDHNLAKADGATPFHIACYQGRQDMVLALLNSDKIDHNLAKADGATPFHIACYQGRQDMVLALLNSGKINLHRKPRKSSNARSRWTRWQAM